MARCDLITIGGAQVSPSRKRRAPPLSASQKRIVARKKDAVDAEQFRGPARVALTEIAAGVTGTLILD
jgi:hypothetical protein